MVDIVEYVVEVVECVADSLQLLHMLHVVHQFHLCTRTQNFQCYTKSAVHVIGRHLDSVAHNDVVHQLYDININKKFDFF